MTPDAGPALRLSVLWWVLAIAWAAIIAWLSLMPVPPLGQFKISDKIEHALGYSSLFLCFAGLVRRSRWWLLVLSCWLFGASLEILQSALAWGRRGDWFDLLANSLGIALGLVLAHWGLSLWPRFIETKLGLAAPESQTLP